MSGGRISRNEIMEEINATRNVVARFVLVQEVFVTDPWKTKKIITDIMSKYLENLFYIWPKKTTFIESKVIVSKVWADMSWGWGGGEGTGRGISHGAPWSISKFQGNHKKTQHLVGHCNIKVKVRHMSQLIGARFLLMASSLQSWLFNSCDIKQILCRISVEEWNWWW